MRNLLNKPWFVVALAVAAVGLVAWRVMDLAKPNHSRSIHASDEAEMSESADGYTDPNDNGGDPNFIRDALRALVIQEPVRDPLTPLRESRDSAATVIETVRGPDVEESLTLTAIWEQGSVLLLVINNHIHEVGDRIGRLTIESADLEGVWLKHWKGRDFLPFGGEFTLVTPAATSANSTTASDES